MPRPALGLIETSGIDGAIKATRAASDAGKVVIVSAERTDADRMTVKIEGDWTAVQTAIEAGARAADKAGQLISMHVIPRSDNGVSPILPYPRFVDRYQPDDRAPSKKKPRSAKPRPKSRPVAPKPMPAEPAPPVELPRPKATPRPQPVPNSKPVAASDLPSAEPVSAPTEPQVEPVSPPAEKPDASPDRDLSAVGDELSWDVLQAMAVVKLRKYARSIVELPIKGREISKANKQQLLEAIASIRKGTA